MNGYREGSRAQVVSFVAAYRRLSSSVISDVPQLSSLSDIVREVRGGRVPRRAALTGGVRYQVHGIGCMMVGADGVIVDVDFLADGRAIFDVIRLAEFVQSTMPDVSLSRDDLLAACRSAVVEGLVGEVREGWFVVERRDLPITLAQPLPRP